MRWTEKYRPKTLDDVLGNDKAVSDLRGWARAWDAGTPEIRAAILYGPAGVGKTSAALALADEMDWDYIEMNASDQRTAGRIQDVAGPASTARTFSGKRRLIILDEADNLHGTYDRGGAAAILKLVRGTSQPVLLIANEYYGIEKPLRDACLGIQFRSIRATTISQTLREICRDEGIVCDGEALIQIAETAGGDLRSAVNDLQAAAEGLDHLTRADVATGERDVKASIFKVLETIFKGPSASAALTASYSLDESPEDLIHWIDENTPLVYQGEDLLCGYEMLSRADVFLGRVGRRQNYSLWRYASFFMTAGIQAARSRRAGGYTPFKPPSLWRRMGQTRRARGIRDSAARKMAAHCHVSTEFARAELLRFAGLLLKDRDLAPRVAALLDLNAEEIALLVGSTPTTKKVQSIFEESHRLREEERMRDMPDDENTGQRPDLAQDNAASAEAGRAQPGTDDAERAEDAKEVAKPEKQEPKRDEKAAKRGRGRPRKDAAAAAKETKDSIAPSAQKQQKSLLEF